MTFRVAFFSLELGKSISRHFIDFLLNQVIFAWKIRTKFSQMAVERLGKWPQPRTCTFSANESQSLQHTNCFFGRFQWPFLSSRRPCNEFCVFLFPVMDGFHTLDSVCAVCMDRVLMRVNEGKWAKAYFFGTTSPQSKWERTRYLQSNNSSMAKATHTRNYTHTHTHK